MIFFLAQRLIYDFSERILIAGFKYRFKASIFSVSRLVCVGGLVPYGACQVFSPSDSYSHRFARPISLLGSKPCFKDATFDGPETFLRWRLSSPIYAWYKFTSWLKSSSLMQKWRSAAGFKDRSKSSVFDRLETGLCRRVGCLVYNIQYDDVERNTDACWSLSFPIPNLIGSPGLYNFATPFRIPFQTTARPPQ